MHPPLTAQEYASRRGVAKHAVQKAIRTGRLKASVVGYQRSPDEPPVDRIGDPELADREWEANTRPVMRMPPAEVLAGLRAARTPHQGTPEPEDETEDETEDEETPGGIENFVENFNRARARHEEAKAQLAEIKLAEAKGSVLLRGEAAAGFSRMLVAFRTAVLGVPSRAIQALPHLTPSDLEVLESLVSETLEHLTEWQP